MDFERAPPDDYSPILAGKRHFFRKLQVANCDLQFVLNNWIEIMTHLRSITLFALLLAFGLPLAATAQPQALKKSLPGVAFTKVDRSQLWIKRFDTAAYVTMKR